MRIKCLTIFLILPLFSMGQNHPSISSVFLFQYGAPESSLDSLNLELYDEKEYGEGHYYKVLLIDKESGTYAVVRFLDFRSEYIYSAQVTGNSPDVPLIEGLSLGDSKQKVFELLGPPSDSNYVADADVMHYTYENRNYSAEIGSDGKLYSFAMHGDDGLLEKNGWPENWQRYELGALAIETKRIKDLPVPIDSNTVRLVSSPLPFRPRVQFTGNTRPLSKSNQKVLNSFADMNNRSDIIELFQTEIEVVEKSTTYWLPIQESLMEGLNKYTNNGKYPVDLFVTYIGHTSETVTFLVNEFIPWD